MREEDRQRANNAQQGKCGGTRTGQSGLRKWCAKESSAPIAAVAGDGAVAAVVVAAVAVVVAAAVAAALVAPVAAAAGAAPAAGADVPDSAASSSASSSRSCSSRQTELSDR
jgi:hypothetical protein